MFGNSRDEIEEALTAAERWKQSEDHNVAFKIATIACLGPNELARLKSAFTNIPPDSRARRAASKLIRISDKSLNFGRAAKLSF